MLKDDFKKIMCEFWASFILGYLGLGGVVGLVVYHSLQNVFQFGLAFAIIIGFVIIIFAPVSGAHFNPALTLPMAMFGGFPWRLVVPYFVAQILGWFAGAAALYGTFRQDIVAFEAANSIVRGMDSSLATSGIFICNTKYPVVGTIAEVVMTALLILMVFVLTDKNNPHKPSAALFPFLMGLTVCFLICFGGPLTGTAINPARDLGPRLFIWLTGWGKVAFPGLGYPWYIYVVGPMLGGILGGWIYKSFIGKLYVPLAESVV